ncbi:hypothetical protein CAEBREN_13873 [Caenorhabditis brenneri]|uniref:Protein transport protein sec16 n=1 Tax=Caenorhabditis brenneri TaxID=135651 RepID=G0NBA9_CAEBE|nr:hypothetical protein CAEBREN_13873 [Caenorhabditis brenneri]
MQQKQFYRGQEAPQHYQQSHQGDDDEKVLYHCGVSHVNMNTWRRLKGKHGIPSEFYNLNPIEKPAFMFYTVVFKQPYRNVAAFHNKLNRMFYKYVWAGDSNEDTLFKICSLIQYIEQQREKQLADPNMKALLFSDDPDGQSETNSDYEESLNAYDIYNNGPLKFTCPHSFLHISTGAQIISIQPDQSISAVSRFLQTRSLNNPVTTLVSVAKGENAPVLTNPPLDDHMSWRTHAAITLANLGERETALSSIHKLGEALATRDYHCAADFCFLVCGVLGGKNPFEPELTPSVEYQTTLVKYAKLLANHGFYSDVFSYCTGIAREIWFHLPLFKGYYLLELCDLAESLYHKADANPQTLKAGFVTRQQLETVTETVAEAVNVEEPPQNYGYQQQQPELTELPPSQPGISRQVQLLHSMTHE